MKMLRSILACALLSLSVDAYSKYGRTCKDIGCLNNEVCIMAEDPCSYGRTSDCGTYPTCKKKTAADGGTQNVPVTKPTTPRPIADLKPQPPGHDDVPHYPPPAPPRGSSHDATNTYGGYPFSNNNNGGGGGYPSSGGGGGYPSSGGGSRYPSTTNTGGGGGGSSSGGSNPFGNFNFGSIFGNTDGKPASSGGSNPFGSIFGNSDGKPAGSGGSNPFGTIFSNILSNFTKNGLPSFTSGFNTRPIIENNRNSDPNPYGNPSNQYPSYPNPQNNGQNYPGYNNPYQRPGSNYPSYNQPSNAQGQPTQQNGYFAKNYGQSQTNSLRNAATTTSKPYGWSYGFSLICILAAHITVRI